MIPQRATEIMETVSNYSHIPMDEITSQSRTANLVLYRHLAMYFLRSKTTLSLQDIAYAVGASNHATVIHALQKLNGLIMIGDSKVKKPFQELSELLN